jgi:hypothetical protein
MRYSLLPEDDSQDNVILTESKPNGILPVVLSPSVLPALH